MPSQNSAVSLQCHTQTTNMNDTQKNIIIVIDYAFSESEKDKCKGIRYSLKPGDLYAHTTYSAYKFALEGKKKLFLNMPDNCESFKSIHNSAKKALAKLQKNIYDFEVVEFINIFFSIERVFIKDLKYVGIREIEFKGIKTTSEPTVDILKPISDKVIYLDENINGKELSSTKILNNTDL